jgi:hypothetical protein
MNTDGAGPLSTTGVSLCVEGRYSTPPLPSIPTVTLIGGTARTVHYAVATQTNQIEAETDQGSE